MSLFFSLNEMWFSVSYQPTFSDNVTLFTVSFFCRLPLGSRHFSVLEENHTHLTVTTKHLLNNFLCTHHFSFSYICFCLHQPLHVSGADMSTCSQDTCANQGTCLNSVSTSGNVCDCDLTSFTGPRCSDGKMILCKILF